MAGNGRVVVGCSHGDEDPDTGGRFYVCPICFKERDLSEDELVENAELKGASPLMDFAGDGALTFTY
jgi:uncharacterized protein